MTPFYAQAALQGTVQGLTEFLPVSSSAHLILARAFFNFDSDKFGIAFDVACHVGTLVAVVAYFRREVMALVAAIPSMFRRPMSDRAWQLWLIGFATLPAIVVGLVAGDAIEDHLRTPAVAAGALAIGGLVLFAVERMRPQTRSEASLSIPEAVAIGCAQAAALVPGVSRSGATISMAMYLGLRRDTAARFGFLLGIPAILAAALAEGVKLRTQPSGPETGSLFAIGVATSALVGYLAVKYFIQYLSRHSLDAFAWYRLALAAVVVAWLITR